MNAVAGRVGKVQKETWNDKEMQKNVRAGDTKRSLGGGAKCVSVEEEYGVLQDYREQRGVQNREEKKNFIIL